MSYDMPSFKALTSDMRIVYRDDLERDWSSLSETEKQILVYLYGQRGGYSGRRLNYLTRYYTLTKPKTLPPDHNSSPELSRLLYFLCSFGCGQ